MNQLLDTGKMKFISRARDVHSQTGEDGIVEAILGVMPERNKWCVEFGAWDGIYLSNTRHLIENNGYSAVLIEADPKSCKELVKNNAAFDHVTCIRAFVGFDKSDSLDVLLAKTECPLNFDFLSVDIDGNDIHVWRAVERYRPKLVCIEFNPTIPDGVLFEQPRDPAVKWGSSLDAYNALAQTKNYKLVCVTEANAFFMSNECFELIPDIENYVSTERKDPPEPVALFFAFDGTLLTSRDVTIPWHNVSIKRGDIQPLPSYFRRYPLDFTRFQKLLMRAYKRLRGWR